MWQIHPDFNVGNLGLEANAGMDEGVDANIMHSDRRLSTHCVWRQKADAEARGIQTGLIPVLNKT